LQTYSPLRWSQKPGLFQPFPSLKRSLGPSELLFSIKRESNFPARITTQLVSLASVTIELIARKNERKKQSKRKSSKEHNKSLSLITKVLCGIGRGFDHFGVSCIECLALVSGWKVENLDDLNVGWLGVFITPTTKLAVWWRLLSHGAPDSPVNYSEAPLKIPEGEEFGLESPGAPDTVRCARIGHTSVIPCSLLLNPFLGLFIGLV
jgi:hypothetical protein